MDAIEFTARYELYIDEISSMIRPDLLPVIEQLRQIDPHDIITPSAWFQSENDARGYVWSMFLLRARKYSKI
jgi:hypothetical protein